MATPATRTRLLDAAEGHFARAGFEGTALRRVIAEAEVNAAAVHYHFGEKKGLLEAVLERRLGALAGELGRRLTALGTRRTAAPGEVLEALLAPVLALDPVGRGLVRRLLTEEGCAWEGAARHLMPALQAFAARLREALPGRGPRRVEEALRLALVLAASGPPEEGVARLFGRRAAAAAAGSARAPRRLAAWALASLDAAEPEPERVPPGVPSWDELDG